MPATLALPASPAPAASQHLVAYSGGLDSSVLLHLAQRADLPGLCAVHIHHGLQASADDWAALCQARSVALGVPLRVVRVQLRGDDPAGPEAAARNARYQALRGVLAPGGLLLTAHHQDDQAETLLLRLLRGAGPDGLAAMRELSGFAPGRLWRPLLHTPRAALLAYAQAQGLDWIEDPHNRDPRYARSWLRTQILPPLQERQPQTSALLARSARLCAEAADALSDWAAPSLLASAHPRWPQALAIPALLAHQPAQRGVLLRLWLQGLGLPLPFADMLMRLQAEVIAARPEAMPLLAWPGVECRRYRDALFASPPLPAEPAPCVLAWRTAEPLTLPAGCGMLTCTSDAELPLLTVRFGVQGARLKPAGDAHTRHFKQLCQSAKLPPWLRGRMPFVYAGETLLSIAGLWNSAEAADCGLQLRWRAPGLPAAPGGAS